MIVHLTDEAVGDLERIGDYIAQDNPRRALSFVLELRDKCLSLASTYQAFPLVSRYGLRRRIHGSYAIFYKVEASRVVIVHILQGAMDLSAVFMELE